MRLDVGIFGMRWTDGKSRVVLPWPVEASRIEADDKGCSCGRRRSR
ncbi:MAG: hypothetical protein QN144_10190 [Armatimonadota bacterium]|nr:hypothetical protein [Armatimonadota bacterium]